MVSIQQSRSRVKRTHDTPPVCQGALTHDKHGNPYERSTPLEHSRAVAFARAFRARPDILEALPMRNHHTTQATPAGERYYVRFVRAQATEGTGKARYAFQDVRAQRAVDQLPEMAFLPCPESAGYCWCVHTYPNGDGECGVYLVSLTSCSCPDFQYTSGPKQLLCKHPLALAIHEGISPDIQAALLRALLPPTEIHITQPTVETVEIRRARLAIAKESDF